MGISSAGVDELIFIDNTLTKNKYLDLSKKNL